MIKKSKLNTCAHCKSKENLHTVFDNDGRLYFICTAHKIILDALVDEAAKVGVRL